MRRLPALVITLLLAPALTGCLEDRGESAGGAGAGEPPVELTIEPDESTLDVPGDEAWTVTLIVREETTIRHRGCPPELVDVFVLLPGGENPERVRLYEYGGEEPMVGACAVRNVTLEPGTRSFTVDWNAHVDPAQPAPHEGERVEPGTYTVLARLAAQDRDVEATAEVTVRA